MQLEERICQIRLEVSAKKMNFIQNFELKSGSFWCKLCGESVAANVPKYYLDHIRTKHHELTEKIAPYMSWSPEQKEELVRLVGESVRQNKYSVYMKGSKTINWDRIADQLNSNRFQVGQIANLAQTKFGEAFPGIA